MLVAPVVMQLFLQKLPSGTPRHLITGSAFKVNASYMRGTDWLSDTRKDQNPNNLKTANPEYPELNGTNNIVYDGWNKYGDDALAGSNTVSITGLKINGGR